MLESHPPRPPARGGRQWRGRGQRRSGRRFLPGSPEAYTYDLDGNLLSDGRWVYNWDGENRLTTMTLSGLTPGSAPAAGSVAAKILAVDSGAVVRVEYTYDHQSRRIAKKTFSWNSSSDSLILSSENLYLYDGWNCIAEVNGGNGLLRRAYLWGLDVSGSMQGAGGVGGQIAQTIHNAQGQAIATYFPVYDGNGNVMALVGATAGDTVANYEYDTFGGVTRQTGAVASANSYRFSTKPQDTETGHLYYGYRFYNPQTGRWINRDPIGEIGFYLLQTGQQILQSINRDASPTSRGIQGAAFGVIQIIVSIDTDSFNEFLRGPGGLNLNCLTGNDPLNFLDYLGLAPFCVCIRADDDHAWIYVKDLATDEEHTYGRWKIGYGRPAANKSGVLIDRELKRGFSASRCKKIENYTPTINEGYTAYNNNCATYARDEWKRVTGEDLDIDEVGNIGWDSPSTLKDSINSKNSGKKKSEDCCSGATKK